MKQLILSVMLVGFAVAVQAGDGQCAKSGACSKAKTEQVSQTQCSKTGACCAKKAQVAKQETVASPKAVEQAQR